MNDLGRTQSLSSDPNRTRLGAPPTVDPNRTILGSAPSLNATQTIKPVQCPVCKAFNPAGVMYCVDCGLIFERALPEDAFGAPSVQLPVLVASGGHEYPIRPGENVVGREGDIVLADPMVSRRHAKITYEPSGIFVEDLGSTNGTKVNGVRLGAGERRAVSPGDTVSFGGIETAVSLPAQAGATAVLGAHKTAAMAAPPRADNGPDAAPVAWVVGDGIELPLRAGANTFGRKSDNDVCVADGYVSGRHGRFEVEDGKVFYTDIGSTNGTLVNSAKLEPNRRTRIHPGDEIQIGALVLKVRLASQEE
ncbi:MAG: FHA domain-containing protein [Fimbriimonadaceae bacterium]